MSAPIALPMYDLPEVRAETDRLGAALAEALGEGAQFGRFEDLQGLWTHPRLALAQTCGYPYVQRLRGRARLVATPAYAARGCEGARYRSLIVVGADHPARDFADLRGARAAVNEPMSQSGAHVLRLMMARSGPPYPFHCELLISGGHRHSVAMVARGEADFCAVDCVTHALLAGRAAGELEGTRVLCETPSAPGLPLVTRGDADDEEVARLRGGLAEIFADPALAETRAALLLTGFEALEDTDYDELPAMSAEIAAAGVPAI